MLNNSFDISDKDKPKYMVINNIKYAFKKKLTNDRYSYRCYHIKCKVLLTIDKANIIKIIENKEILLIL